MAHKTYVEIYKAVKFIEENHSKLFPTEIINRIGISYTMLKKVAADLGLELLTIDRADKVLLREDKPKRKYKKRKNERHGFFSELIYFLFHTKKQGKKVA